jgi:DNA-directed RNA polymerase subunit K
MINKKEEKSEEIKYTKYEIARMLGSRALQLALGAPFLVKISEKELERIKYNPLKIAEMEFNQGVLPITVKRPLPGQKR